MLQQGSQLRTPIDRTSLRDTVHSGFSDTDPFFAKTQQQLLSLLVSWTTLLYEEWLDQEEHFNPPSDWLENDSVDLTFLFRILWSANLISGRLPGDSLVQERKVSLAGGRIVLGKNDLDPSSVEARLAFVDGLSRIVLTASGRAPTQQISPTTSGCTDTQREETRVMGKAVEQQVTTQDRDIATDTSSKLLTYIFDLQQRVKVLEFTPSTQPAPAYDQAAKPSALGQLEVLARLRLSTILLIMAVSYVLVHRIVELCEHARSAFLDASKRFAG